MYYPCLLQNQHHILKISKITFQIISQKSLLQNSTLFLCTIIQCMWNMLYVYVYVVCVCCMCMLLYMYVPAHFVVSSTRHEAQLLTAASPDLHGSTKSCAIHKNVSSIAVFTYYLIHY